MAKILTDKELGEIVWKATHDEDLIDCADSYAHFLEDLGDLICTHFGGERGSVGEPYADLPWTVGIHINECVPADGGVYKDYDTDIQWAEGEEHETSNSSGQTPSK